MAEIVITVEGSKGGAATSRFTYLWAKHVQGFNPKHHCAACLRGPWEKTIQRGMKDGEYPIHLLGPYFYICGVAPDYRYVDNFHLAVRPAEGRIAVADTFCGTRFTIYGAEQIPITPLPDGFDGRGRKYTTCRNFQFAVQQFGLPKDEPSLFG